MEDRMLTTFDNPFDPFSQFNEWFQFDTEKGYNTCGLLARFAKTSEALSPEQNDQEIDYAMNEIVNQFPLIYKIVTKKIVSDEKE